MPRNNARAEVTYVDILRSLEDQDLLPVVESLHDDFALLYADPPPAGLAGQVIATYAPSASNTSRTLRARFYEMRWEVRKLVRRPAVLAFAIVTGAVVAGGAGYAMHQRAAPGPARQEITVSGDGTPRYIVPAPASAVYYPSFIPSGLAERMAGEVFARPAFGRVTGQWAMSVYCPPAGPSYPYNQPEGSTCGLNVVSHNGPIPPIHVTLGALGSPAFIESILRAVAPRTAASPIIVWVGMHTLPPGHKYMAIVEWRVGTGSFQLRGTVVTIAGRHAVMSRRNGHSAVLLQRGQTKILVQTNVSRRELLKLIRSLHPIDVSQAGEVQTP